MRLRKIDTALCRRCRAPPVWYGLKEETTGWKVFCVCGNDEHCGHEWKAGWISMHDVASRDEALRRGEALCKEQRGTRRPTSQSDS